MTRDEAWAALRAAYPGKTHSICIDIADWDMRHTDPFVWFTVSIQPGPNGGTCWRSQQVANLAKAVEEAVKMAQAPAPVPGEVEAYFEAAEPALAEPQTLDEAIDALAPLLGPVPELTRAETRRFEAALADAAAQGFEGPAVEAPRTQCRRVDPALVDPDWPTHDENGLKPPADGSVRK